MPAFVAAAALLAAFTLLSLLRPWHRRGADAIALSRRTALLIALAVPTLGAAMYAALGHPGALDDRARPRLSQNDAERSVAALAARLAEVPDNPKGWTTLARAYRAMGRTAEAQAAFERIGPALERDPVLLAEYADVLGDAANGKLEGRPMELVTRALQLDPDTPTALALAATAAYERRDMAEAVKHWERLLAHLPPESDDAKWVLRQLAEVRAAGSAAGPR